MKKKWNDYLWIASISYLVLGLFNILFAWLGLICFMVPLLIAIFKGNKSYCNRYCRRGQLFTILGDNLRLSQKRDIPKWMKTKIFRYGFLTFFMMMFSIMIFKTYLVFKGTNELKKILHFYGLLNYPGIGSIPRSSHLGLLNLLLVFIVLC